MLCSKRVWHYRSRKTFGWAFLEYYGVNRLEDLTAGMPIMKL